VTADRSDGGFTLVELLLTTVITSVIIGALATVVMVTINLYPENANRLAQSNDAQRLASWFVPDVVSLGAQNGDIDTNAKSGSSCKNVPSSANVPSANANVLKLTWTDFGTPTKRTWEADYRRVPGSPVLTRYFCQTTLSGSSAVVGRNVHSTTVSSTGTQLTLTVFDLDNHGKPGPGFSVSANRRTLQPPVPASVTTQPPATTIPLARCTIKTASVTPAQSQLENDKSGHLQDDLTIAVTTSGACNGSLQVSFQPDSNGPSVTFLLDPAQYGQIWKGTIPSTQYTWTPGIHRLFLQQVVGQQAPQKLLPQTKNPILFRVNPANQAKQ
jgi:hypothetical protein